MIIYSIHTGIGYSIDNMLSVMSCFSSSITSQLSIRMDEVFVEESGVVSSTV